MNYMEKRNQSGMTLVELLVAIVMFGIILTAVYSVFRVHNLMAAKQEENTLMQQELLATMVQISEDLRMCGYTPSSGNFGVGNIGSNLATNATSVYCNSTDGDTAYRLNVKADGTVQAPADNVLKVYNASGQWEQVAINISNLRFTYMNSDGDIIADPTTNPGSIRSVEITATAIPSPERSALGINSRTMSTSVYCRNLGL